MTRLDGRRPHSEERLVQLGDELLALPAGDASRRARGARDPPPRGARRPRRGGAAPSGSPAARARSRRAGRPRAAPPPRRRRRCRAAPRATSGAVRPGTARPGRATSSQRSSASPSSRSSSAAPSLPISDARGLATEHVEARRLARGLRRGDRKHGPNAERAPVEPLEQHRPRGDRPARGQPERRDRVGDLARRVGWLAAVGGHRLLELEHAHPVGLAAEALRAQARGIGPVRDELAVCGVPDPEPVSERDRLRPPRPRRAERWRRRRARRRTSTPRAPRTPGRRRRRPSRNRRTPRRRRPTSGSSTVRKSACSDWARA